MNIAYSVIVPHKNCPDLLSRCLDSIPDRDDIQIIVVDDNSDSDKKPGYLRDGIDLILLDASNAFGAGRARNAGLQHAKGKWLLFADADDFFMEGFLKTLDKYKSSDYDVVYFNSKYVDCDTLDDLPKPKRLRYIDMYDGSQCYLERIKYMTNVPWAKMIRRDYISTYNMQYEEIMKGNDTFFSYQVAYYSNKIVIDKTIIYVYTRFQGSITNGRKSMNVYKQSLKNAYKCRSFFRFIGHPEYSTSKVKFFLSILKREGFCYWLHFLWMFILYYSEIVAEKDKYVNHFKINRGNNAR